MTIKKMFGTFPQLFKVHIIEWKCNILMFPHVSWLDGRLVGMSVIIPKQGSKLQFHSPLGTIATGCHSV